MLFPKKDLTHCMGVTHGSYNITSHMNYPNGTQASYGFAVSDINSVYQQFIDKGIKVGKISNYANIMLTDKFI